MEEETLTNKQEDCYMNAKCIVLGFVAINIGTSEFDYILPKGKVTMIDVQK